MIDAGRKNVLGILVSAVDYEAAVEKITTAAKLRQPLAVTALAVHGVMTGYNDAEQRFRLNSFDLVLPDGQPVRWALNILHRCQLQDRVYGPTIMLKVCEEAARMSLPVYFYGSTEGVIAKLCANLSVRFPELRIAGAEPSMFRRLSPEERRGMVQRIESSGAAVVFVGLGCPRQEVFVYELRDELSAPVLAVGAAFTFHAGTLLQAPRWMQDHALEWLFRFSREPIRLWRRYVLLNPAYLYLVALQRLGWRFSPAGTKPQVQKLFG